MNRPVAVFFAHKELVKQRERRFVKVETAFVDELLGSGIIKVIGHKTFDTLTAKVKFERHKVILEVVNDSNTTIGLDPNKALTVSDIKIFGIL